MSVHGAVVLEELSPDECLELLTRSSVGRIAVSVRALPVILPVNYVLRGEDVIFRTTSGTKLSAASAGTVVAFEVDHYDPDGLRGWSVLVQGRAGEVDDPDELAALRTLPLHAWALDGSADHFVRIRCTLVSGRRFEPVTAQDGPSGAVSPPGSSDP